MKFGVLALTEATAPFNTSLDYSRIKDFVLEAEELGYESVWFPDHLYVPIRKFLGEEFECMTVMAACAAITRKIRLGANVLCNLFRYPSILAKQSTTLDIISEGRYEFAIGSGWYQDEADSYGIPFPSFKVRSEMLKEALEVIKLMWVEDSPSFSGKYYRIKGAVNLPRPVQKPHPPIIIGGMSRRYTLPLAAEYADELNVYAISPERCGEVSELLDRIICDDTDRDPKDVKRSIVLPILTSTEDADVREKTRRLHHHDMREGYESYSLFGVPEVITEKVQKYADSGMDRVILNFLDFPDTEGLRVFAEDVLGEL